MAKDDNGVDLEADKAMQERQRAVRAEQERLDRVLAEREVAKKRQEGS